jgi:heme iron utilization protein
MSSQATAKSPGALARSILRRTPQAALATLLRADAPDVARAGIGGPYASLVLVGLDYDASPLLLISDLSDHSRNIKSNPAVSLLFDGTAGFKDRLAGPRVSLLGRAAEAAEKSLAGRYLARHPSARLYAGFGDFRLYRVEPESAHMVAGFGRISWLSAANLKVPIAAPQDFSALEGNLVATDGRSFEWGAALARNAGLPAAGTRNPWRLTGIDPDGCDLAAGKRLARVDFPAPESAAEGARKALAALAGFGN